MAYATAPSLVIEARPVGSPPSFSLRHPTTEEKLKNLVEEIGLSSAFSDEEKSLANKAIEILPQDQAISYLFHRIVTPIALDGDERIENIAKQAEELLSSLEDEDPLIEAEIQERVAKTIKDAVIETCKSIESDLAAMQKKLQKAIEKKSSLEQVLFNEITKVECVMGGTQEAGKVAYHLATSLEAVTEDMTSTEKTIQTLCRKYCGGK